MLNQLFLDTIIKDATILISNIDIDKEAIEQINHKLFKELVNWYKKNPDLIKIETVNTPTDFGILVTHTATIKLIPLKP